MGSGVAGTTPMVTLGPGKEIFIDVVANRTSVGSLGYLVSGLLGDELTQESVG